MVSENFILCKSLTFEHKKLTLVLNTEYKSFRMVMTVIKVIVRIKRTASWMAAVHQQHVSPLR